MTRAAATGTTEVPGNGANPARRNALERMEKALEYMRHHLDQPLPMAAISKLTGVSMSAFYSLFKLATGHTPNDFFTRVRMQQAGRLLLESDLSVKEVATTLGYDDPFYFSRVFKVVHGVAPSQFRAERAHLNGEQGTRPVRADSVGWRGWNGRNTLAQTARSPWRPGLNVRKNL